MTHDAVVPLLQLLDTILNPHLKKQHISHDKNQILSLQKTMKYFRDHFLKVSWRPTELQDSRTLGLIVKDKAHKAQDIIESYISEERKRRRKWFRGSCVPMDKPLDKVKHVLDSLVEKAHELALVEQEARARILSRPDTSRQAVIAEFTLSKPSKDGDTLVGFEDVRQRIYDQLVYGSGGRTTIAIVGMGGSGKTTLAKHLYNDRSVSDHFDVKAWVTLSKTFDVSDIWSNLIYSMRKGASAVGQDPKLFVHQCLVLSKCLIVLDDVWPEHEEVWNELSMLFTNGGFGTRILLTTRTRNVASAANARDDHIHEMPLWRYEESWELILQEVFGEQTCPPELKVVGKRIAQSCRGLPLAAKLISGMLKKIQRRPSHWEYFAGNIGSFENVHEDWIYQYVMLSYTFLPSHLKTCFLYMGIFVEDREIPVSKLIRQWIAEGFVEPNGSKNLEEVGQEYVEDLISRNLVQRHKKRFDGSTKSCKVHDVIKKLCLIKAAEEKFFDSVNFKSGTFPQPETCSSRLKLSDGPPRLFAQMPLFPKLRSLIHTGASCSDELHNYCCCELLRVLDLSKVELGSGFDKILLLCHLRYLAFSCTNTIDIPKSMPESLWYLVTLIIHQKRDDEGTIVGRVRLPPSMEKMTQLRHLIFGKADFPPPKENLDNLETLVGVSSSSCTTKLLEKTPKLKKLGIEVEKSSDGGDFSLDCVAHLSLLEVLICYAEPGSSVSVDANLILPHTLKKITLNNTRIPWENMSAIGSLTNLLVLELLNFAFQGKEWTTKDDEFRNLQHLLIHGTDLQKWNVERIDHLPVFQKLIVRKCYNLEEIPLVFAELNFIKEIDVDDASTSVVTSVKEIKKVYEEIVGDDSLSVSVLYDSWTIKEFQEHSLKRHEKEEKEKRKKNFEEEQTKHNPGPQGFTFDPRPGRYRYHRVPGMDDRMQRDHVDRMHDRMDRDHNDRMHHDHFDRMHRDHMASERRPHDFPHRSHDFYHVGRSTYSPSQFPTAAMASHAQAAFHSGAHAQAAAGFTFAANNACGRR